MVPYFSDPLEHDENDPNAVGGAAPTAPAPGQAAPGGAQKPEKTGSGFQNIDKYVSANSGQNFGNQVVGKVQGDVDKAGQSMQDASQSFGQKVDANKAYGKDQVDSALNDPAKADAKAFQAGIDQQYKGPKSLAESQDDYNKFTGDTNKAKTAAGQLGSEAGRFSLLDNYFGRSNYGFGQKSLDNALFQATPGAGQAANGVQQQANALQGQGKQMQAQLQDQASKRAGEIEQARNYERGQLGFDQNGQVVSGQGAFGGLQKDLASGLQAAQSARTGNQAALQQALQSGNAQGYDLSDEQMKSLGVDPGMQTYGVNIGDYIHNGNAVTSVDQIATDAQRAKLQGLNQLVGQGYAQNMLGDKADFGSDYSLDKDNLNAAIASAKNPAEATGNAGQHLLDIQAQGPAAMRNDPTYLSSLQTLGGNGLTQAQLNDKANAAVARMRALQGMKIY